MLDTYRCSGALDNESLRELYSKIGTVIDDPQEEEEYVDDEYVSDVISYSSEFLFDENMQDDDFDYFDDFNTPFKLFCSFM